MPNAIAVVAHHDDAILWMGGAIQRLRNAGWNWTVVAMCVPDSARQDYFARCCDILDVSPVPMDFKDYQDGEVFCRNSQQQMQKRLTDAIRGKEFDLVFTHSRDPNGEYGRHANHLEVVAVVDTLVKGGSLGRGSVAYFCYEAIYGLGGLATVAKLKVPSRYLQLTYPELKLKCEWCNQAPDADNLRNLAFPCPNPEAFEVDDLKLPDGFVSRR